MPLLKRFCVLILGLATFLVMSSVVRADAVTDWNAIAIQIIVNTPSPATPSHPGATSFLDSAIVQAAVYDAVESITGRFRPYAIHVPGASGSTAAAVAKAAHDVLVNRFPSQTVFLDTTYHAYLTAHGLAETDAGVAVGRAAAAGIIALRANDGSFPNCSPMPPPPLCRFVGSTDIGVWRPTPSFLPGPPPSNSPMLAPWLSVVTPFTLTSNSQFRAVPPPSLTSKRYAAAYNEVKSLGARFNSGRTAEQTEIGLFWYSNYLVLWYHALRDIADAHVHNIDDSARLFALTSLAMGDAVLTAWDTKYHYASNHSTSWRPITAIRNGDSDGNPETVADPNWEPLQNNPNYPEYSSGANNVTGAVTRMLALFFGTDEMTFTVTTTNHPPAIHTTRTYNRFSDAAADVLNARIYAGIHFRYADVQGRKQGRHVAQWVFGHFLRSVDDDDHDDHDDSDDE
jgi:hypothetical protein